jgi:hypothetical protein
MRHEGTSAPIVNRSTAAVASVAGVVTYLAVDSMDLRSSHLKFRSRIDWIQIYDRLSAWV